MGEGPSCVSVRPSCPRTDAYVCTHGQHVVLFLLCVVESVLQGRSVFFGDFLQGPGLALLHLADLLFGSTSHGVHLLLVGQLLLTQGLTRTKKRIHMHEHIEQVDRYQPTWSVLTHNPSFICICIFFKFLFTSHLFLKHQNCCLKRKYCFCGIIDN